MKKFIKSYLTAFIVLIAVIMNGCDIFENFQFGLPVRFEIEALTTAGNPLGSQTFCFESNDTYQQYEDDINSINFVAAYIVTLDVFPAALTGNAKLRLYEYNQTTQQVGKMLFEHTENNYTPAEHDSTNAYKLNLTADQIAAINQSLLTGPKCFYGEYEVEVASPNVINYVKVRIDALFNVDAKLD
jgi:hypothetical protein